MSYWHPDLDLCPSKCASPCYSLLCGNNITTKPQYSTTDLVHFMRLTRPGDLDALNLKWYSWSSLLMDNMFTKFELLTSFHSRVHSKWHICVDSNILTSLVLLPWLFNGANHQEVAFGDCNTSTEFEDCTAILDTNVAFLVCTLSCGLEFRL